MTQISIITGKEEKEVLPEPLGSPKKRYRISGKWGKCLCGFAVAFCIALMVGVVGLLCSYIYWGITYVDCEKNSTLSAGVQGLQDKEPYTFDDIFDPSLRPRGYGVTWMKGGSVFVRRNSSGDLVEYDAETDEVTLIVPNSVFEEVGASSFFVAGDMEHVLLAYDVTRQWRYSFSARYKIYSRNEPTEEALRDFPNGELAGEKLQYAGWDPSTAQVALSFVHGNDLYYQSDVSADPVQLTTTGETEMIFNGVPDWLYEEDVISSRVAHYWSENGGFLCYVVFDVTEVPRMKWPHYGSKDDVYDDVVEVAYPKAGDVRGGNAGPNTQVDLYLVDLSDLAAPHKHIPPPAQFEDQDHYYTRVEWRDNTHVAVAWSNRPQNHTILLLCDVTTTPVTCQQNLESVITGGWNPTPWSRPRFIDDGESYLTVYRKSEGDDFFKHVALVTSSMDAAGTVTFLSSGEQEVTSIVGYEEERKLVFYYSTNGDPRQRHLFRVGTPAAEEPDREPVCMTCEGEEACPYVSASFSDDGSHYILGCLGPDIPTYRLKTTDGSKNLMMEDNAAVKERLDQKNLPERQFVQVDVGGGYTANAAVYLPPGYEPGNQYPMIVYSYAGPGSLMAVQNFPIGSNTINWLRYLGSSQNVLVASLDGRGSANLGEKILFELYRKLGTVEVNDQIEGARNLKSLDYVNENENAAIFGWSYGGFVAALGAANESPDAFQCAISVAPVATYMYYDTAYTERYMGLATPGDNEAGYNATDVMNKVELFRDKKYLIAHGTADDNVHFMHMAQLVQALVQEEIQFRSQMYIDENHGIGGSSRHLYRAMTNFLLDDCWEGRYGRSK